MRYFRQLSIITQINWKSFCSTKSLWSYSIKTVELIENRFIRSKYLSMTFIERFVINNDTSSISLCINSLFDQWKKCSFVSFFCSSRQRSIDEHSFDWFDYQFFSTNNRKRVRLIYCPSNFFLIQSKFVESLNVGSNCTKRDCWLLTSHYTAFGVLGSSDIWIIQLSLMLWFDRTKEYIHYLSHPYLYIFLLSRFMLFTSVDFETLGFGYMLIKINVFKVFYSHSRSLH